MPLKILGVSGSMRETSRSTLALKIILEGSKSFGAETRLLDLRKYPLPFYDPSRRDDTDEHNIRRIDQDVNWADALILASPDYHGSMSGTIKNFLDHYWSEFAGKTFAYVCTSHERGLTVMDQMRTAVRQCYGWSMPYGASFNGDQDFDENGLIVNLALERRLKMLARDLVIYGKIIRDQFLSDIASDEVATFAARYRG
ncbi:MAG TPA: NADPH-dependent FMN reductase [Nitrososphaeraceae archaeon]|jgi:FMN reductase